MTDLQAPLTTLPHDLFVSKLPNAEKEFFCFICFPSLTIGEVKHFSWQIDSQEVYLEGKRSITDREYEQNRVSLSAVLPREFETGQLKVQLASCQQTWQIRSFVQKDTFRLPLAGQVLVLVGHRIGESHRSAPLTSQHFGWDLLPLHKNGLRLLKGPLSENLKAHEFEGFGQPVLAPGNGVVARALDGMEDLMQVGELPTNVDYYLEDLTRALGNHVIIDHDHGVWSCLAHLKQGSVQVKDGQEIKTWDKLGELGSSGFGSGPHVHLQFMNGPDISTASSLPIELSLEGGTYAPQAGEITSS
jgi:murein DD-endopeptidase MepM/ murein hydrolase activator NlpD